VQQAHAHAAVLDPGHATTTGLNHRKLLMWTFLGSECLFFGSLIATYMTYRGRSLVGPYPAEMFDIPFTSVSTFVLLMSSLMMVLALAAIQRGDQRRTAIWLMATALLGSLFLGGQYYEFTTFYREGLELAGQPFWLPWSMFSTTFFVLTGFHGTHVTIGVIWLISLWIQVVRGELKQEHSLHIEIAGLYWHFVDVVWIVIFTAVYLLHG
jgi:heme/copper-type cytochrome/quinol oxidase subunit 3